MPSTSTLLVGSDVIFDVTADATLNKAADDVSVNTNIGMVRKDIVYEDEKKSVIADVIADAFADMAEDEVDDAIVQSGVENDDRHGAGNEIVIASDDNVVDQVSQT